MQGPNANVFVSQWNIGFTVRQNIVNRSLSSLQIRIVFRTDGLYKGSPYFVGSKLWNTQSM